MDLVLRLLGYAALSLITMFLLATGLWDVVSSQAHWAWGLIAATIFLFFLRGVHTEWQASRGSASTDPVLSAYDLLNGLAVWSGGMLTFALHLELGFTAVVASCITGIAAHVFVRRFAVAAYCGSFVGMASAAVFPHYAPLAAAACAAALVYVAAKFTFGGFGGKLGTVAFAGSVPVALLFGYAFTETPALQGPLLVQLVFFSVAAAVITYILNIRLGWGSVLASALVGLAAGIALPLLSPANGPLWAVMVFCASFVGMASPKRLPHEGAVAIAGIFCALIFIFSTPYFAGAGGKLGTAAFASTVAVGGLWDLLAPKERPLARKAQDSLLRQQEHHH